MAYQDTYDEAVRAGESPNVEEERARVEARWYADIRRALVVVRRRAGLDQTGLAQAIGSHQSEVSRVENGLSDRTRLGTIRAHIEGAGGSLGIVVLDKGGHVVLDQASGVRAWPDPAEPAVAPAEVSARESGGRIDPARLEAALRPVIASAPMSAPERSSLMDEIAHVVNDMAR